MTLSARAFLMINRLLMISIALLLFVSAMLFILNPRELVLPKSPLAAPFCPKPSFAASTLAYESIGTSLLSLTYVPQKPQLPDLKNMLSYHGMNGRPDTKTLAPRMHFSIAGTPQLTAVEANQKLFIAYDKSASPPRFSFSKNNAETSLWIEPAFVSEQTNQAQVLVCMQDENGEFIDASSNVKEFKLTEKEWMKPGVAANGQPPPIWEISKWRVDGTLLARQQARWFGPDRFLEKHGGEEFKQAFGKQRIDFGEAPNLYSIHMGLGDFLIWKDDHWTLPEANENTSTYPLLYAKKVDDRMMCFELWDKEGQRKIPLTLLKTNEVWPKEEAERSFKFLGARTKSQCVFEVGDERMLLQPHDWLLLTDDGWKKLETEDEIDLYVSRQITGTLFVFDGMLKKEEHQVLTGTLFNPSRSEAEPVELAFQHGNVTVIPKDPAAKPPTNPLQQHASTPRQWREERELAP